jgi:hypothetical protein
LISDGELIVERYLLEKRISLEPESEEYAQFLNSILWGGVMELSKVGTDFVKDQYDLEALEAYCIETVIQILYMITFQGLQIPQQNHMLSHSLFQMTKIKPSLLSFACYPVCEGLL